MLLTPPLTRPWGSACLDLAGRLDVGQGVVVVLLDAGGDGEDVGVEDDVLRREADLFGQDLVGARQMSTLRSTVSAWPSSSKAMTMTAAP